MSIASARRCAAVAAASLVATALAAAPAADAKLTNHKIVPGRSIGGISIGMRRHQVEGMLGADHVRKASIKRGFFLAEYARYTIVVYYRGGSNAAVVGVSTGAAMFKTPEQVNVGSSLSELESAYPDLLCGGLTGGPGKPDPSIAYTGYCDHAGPSGRVTRFGVGGGLGGQNLVRSIAVSKTGAIAPLR